MIEFFMNINEGTTVQLIEFFQWVWLNTSPESLRKDLLSMKIDKEVAKFLSEHYEKHNHSLSSIYTKDETHRKAVVKFFMLMMNRYKQFKREEW